MRTATLLPLGLLDRVTGLKGFDRLSVPVIGAADCTGPGVEKSMSRPSAGFFPGDLDFPLVGLRLRDVSKDGMTFGGVRGTVGFRIDFGFDGEI